MNECYRGDIFYIDYFPTTGSEQRPGRPAIIVSNNTGNDCSGIIEVVYLTAQPKTKLPTHVKIYSTGRKSIALCEQITTISKDRVGSYIATVSDAELSLINKALIISLSLDTALSAKTEASEPSYDAKLANERDIYKELYENLLARMLEKKAGV